MKRKGMYFTAIMTTIFILLPTTVLAADANEVANADLFGIWTLLPPLLAIILAFITKNVVLSLFIGAISGCFLLSLNNGSVFYAFFNSFVDFSTRVLGSLADSWNAGIVLQVLAIGGLIALVGKMGGAKAVAEKLAQKAKSPRSAGLITWLLGLFVFFDDYANSLIVGPIMRPVTDKMKMSREKLAFIVDATAAPIAGLAFISTWVGYEMSLIKDSYESVGLVDISAFDIFIQTIPFRFYNILMLIFVVLTSLLLRDFGPMYKAEKRARSGEVLSKDAKPMATESGDLEPDSNVKLNVWNAIIPIGALILFSIIGFYNNGIAQLGETPDTGSFIENIATAFGAADASIVIFQAALFAGIIALIMGVFQKIFTVKNGIDHWINGTKSLIMTCVILLLAWSLSSVIRELGTRYFITNAIGENFPIWLIPTLIFLIGSAISFATGTSYGTMGILMPLAVPLAANLSGNNEFVMLLCTSAVLTGAILGDHCSPISDTTILSSMGAACDHVDHVKTQLPYAFFVGGVTILFGYIPIGVLSTYVESKSLIMLSVLGIIVIATVAITAFLYIVGKPLKEIR